MCSYLPAPLQADEKARAAAEDAVFAKAWQQHVQELQEEEGEEARARLAEVGAAVQPTASDARLQCRIDEHCSTQSSQQDALVDCCMMLHPSQSAAKC